MIATIDVSREAVSSFFGTVSLVSSLCLLVPQLIMNYRAKSANALSKIFLSVWLLGDLTSLVGGIITSIAPSAIVLSAYLCIADSLLISQCWYYTSYRACKHPSDATVPRSPDNAMDAHESESLIRHDHTVLDAAPENSGPPAVQSPTVRSWIFNAGFICCIYIVGFLAWLLSQSQDSGSGSPQPEGPDEVADASKIGLALGYFGAACYLGAPIPQIIKNARNQSTKGLASLFFLLSLTNNFTYGLSILAYSQERSYLIKSIPWLLGSLGAMVEDITIFLQFVWYASVSHSS